MARIQMSLGSAVFSLTTRALDSFRRQIQFTWVTMDRINRRPAKQWTGRGDETFCLEGVIFTLMSSAGSGGPAGVVGVTQLEEINALAEQGIPLPLSDGNGQNYGMFVIDNINVASTVLLDTGAARKQEYNIDLSVYGDDILQQNAITANGAVNLQATRAGLLTAATLGNPVGLIGLRN